MMPRVKVFLILLCLTGIGVLFRTYSVFSLNWFQKPNGDRSYGYTPLWADSTKLQNQSHVTPVPKNQSLCSCVKCLTEDKQLREHRLVFIQPFLSKAYSLSEGNFNWWKRLQLERCSYNTYQATVKSLFEMFPPDPDLVKPRPDHCRTCAVVGNSHNLKGARYGKLIDSQDVVIRMNFGPTKGYEEDTGTKTTHRALYPESAADLGSTTHLVLFPFKLLDLQWLMKALSTGFVGRSYAPIRAKIQANKTLVMVVNPAFMRYVHDYWLDKKGSYPSTGFMTLALALHMCDEVHVFGFGADSEGNWSHYWQALKNSQSVNGVHPARHEYDAIQRLSQQARIQLYKGV
ncbi:CMP-N-acetylneuraminate-beta-galactosamide-alpha-2,3-sialyltransferase 1-like [Salarias fasciatus]|uniref:CMP-N-acetylneuraminate-beta-galactosamide-alpha-2,3-sialyltransferase 1 n=1 Tax=Salarias fasciatus TaxID=181472 RepID=A0A672GIJ7_SALFA|nr:CMP-N-acetylneuraminate-beta-galactosamide-alpha-2,3-sialyltransferase 1-like [Salarias fasciatus]